MPAQPVHDDRLHALDAVRAFALVLGVHAGFSFLPGMPPGIWAMVDASPSPAIAVLLFVAHIFRMTLFFFVAGFFARMLFHRRGAGGFWRDRLKRILVPFIVGWLVLAPTIGVVWTWGLKTTFGGALPPLPPNLPPPPPGAFPLTHLWFLYYLLILYVLVVAGRSLLSTLDRAGAIRRAADAAVGRLVRSGAAAFVLPLPLVAALLARSDWIMWFGIPTPDQSVIPQLASLLGYGTAVAFGWLAHRQTDVLGVWQRLWPVHLGLAIAASAACLAIGGVTPALLPASRSAGTIAYAAGYGLAIWSWTFALIGMAMRWLSQPDARIRYVADASYWIYLAHLPLVVALQVIAGPLPLHWSLKFPVILVVAFAVLLASYRYLVRATFVGQTLNGRRLPRGLASTLVVPSPPSPGPRTGTDDPADPPGGPGSPAVSTLAMLQGVHKRYGTTHALAGVDLAVRCGEVVALLGPNGAGKTTAIGLWLGLLDADEGQATLAGGPPREIQARRRVGVMMQDVELPPELRVRDLVTLAASYYPNPRSLAETLATTRLEALADRTYGALSGGQKRLVQFAIAICGRPTLLFLDEPTTGLDIEARETVWRTVRALVAGGTGVVLTTHYLEEAEALADRVAVLGRGRLLASGSVSEIRALVARKQIACRTSLDPEVVRGWPGVIGVSLDAERLQITVGEAEDVLRRLLAADAGVTQIEVRRAGLADAFAELTREAA
jgi:ABC-type multidrug transport system ATPase subunit/peptidoglycan/LPS O-acetylase OafA/YrhL